MENLPETLCVDPATPPLPPPTDTATFDVTPIEASSSISQSATVDELIHMLYNPNLREEAMELLNKVYTGLHPAIYIFTNLASHLYTHSYIYKVCMRGLCFVFWGLLLFYHGGWTDGWETEFYFFPSFTQLLLVWTSLQACIYAVSLYFFFFNFFKYQTNFFFWLAIILHSILDLGINSVFYIYMFNSRACVFLVMENAFNFSYFFINFYFWFEIKKLQIGFQQRTNK